MDSKFVKFVPHSFQETEQSWCRWCQKVPHSPRWSVSSKSRALESNLMINVFIPTAVGNPRAAIARPGGSVEDVWRVGACCSFLMGSDHMVLEKAPHPLIMKVSVPVHF